MTQHEREQAMVEVIRQHMSEKAREKKKKQEENREYYGYGYYKISSNEKKDK